MNIYLDCIPCFIRQSLEAARFVTDDEALHEQILRHVLRITADLDLRQSPPVVGQAIHRKIREVTKEKDPYLKAKRRFNRLAIDILPGLLDEVKQSGEPLLTAAKLAIAANVIDLGVLGTLTEADVLEALRKTSEEPFHLDWMAFRQAVAEAKDILYLADNAGEIAIDRLLIGELGPDRVSLAVRGSAVINDATLDDAREVQMHDFVEVIDNGSDAPGTILEDCSASFRERFKQADLIIAKGQGNIETLNNSEGNIFFLFKVKCPVISRHIGLPTGTCALLHSKGLRTHIKTIRNR